MMNQLSFGFKYIFDRRGLLVLLLVFSFSNMVTATIDVVIPPLIMQQATPKEFGFVASFAGLFSLL